jgi:excisionase family DNA binding protein
MSNAIMTPAAAADTPRDGLATVDEAIRYLNLSRSSVYVMLNAGTLPCRRMPGLRAVRIPWSALRLLATVQES